MLIIINGASGAGKTFLLENLHKLHNPRLIPIRKYTTRSTRGFEDENHSIDLIYNCTESTINSLGYHYTHNKHLYDIDKSELNDEIQKGNIPVIIIRSFETIEEIQHDFSDTKVIFIIGATGETLEKHLNSQGRSETECSTLSSTHLAIVKDYVTNMNMIDGCIINCLYNEDLFLKQFEHFII